jgi:hypothetical protein
MLFWLVVPVCQITLTWSDPEVALPLASRVPSQAAPAQPLVLVSKVPLVTRFAAVAGGMYRNDPKHVTAIAEPTRCIGPPESFSAKVPSLVTLPPYEGEHSDAPAAG